MKNPTQQLPAGDVGANTLRNYRYQSVYGVVLLCASAAGKADYRAIWCEQEDDLLAEISDNLFDSYQIKTRTPELGYWDLGFKGFISAISVFLRIEKEFPRTIRYFNFVCDALPLESSDKSKIHKCPSALIEDIRTASDLNALSQASKKGFELLRKKLKCTNEELWSVLKRLRLLPEPIRKEAALEVLIASHMPHVPCCASASQTKLRRAAIDSVSQLDDASRLASLAPERHYACLQPKGADNPQLKGKRVSREEFVKRCEGNISTGFRYVADMSNSVVSRTNPDIRRFFLKLNRGNLEEQADTLRARSLTAEAALLELATRIEGAGDIYHLKALVKGECDDALALASQNPEPFGPSMYRDVIRRLDELAKNEPTKVIEQPREILIGIAGMLTEECRVWWSKRFDIESETN